MRMLIDVFEPIPPWINRSYGDFGFWKFGLCRWVYHGYAGETEWINSPQFCTEPKYDDPDGLAIWMQPGVNYVWHMDEATGLVLPPIKVNQHVVDPITGEGLPLFQYFD